MYILSRYAWVLFILLTSVNARIMWGRARKETAGKPELAEEYRALIRGFLVHVNIPLFIMGIGILFGGVPTMWHYFNPRSSPFVVMFHVSAILVEGSLTYWVLYRNGAEILVAHPAMFTRPIQQPWLVKVGAVLSLAGTLVAQAVLLRSNFPVPM